MAAKISDILKKEGHPGYAIDVAALEKLVAKLREELASAEKALESMTSRAAINGNIAMRYQKALEIIADRSTSCMTMQGTVECLRTHARNALVVAP